MELFYCPACGSPVVMKDAKYCEFCGMDLTPVRKVMEKLRSRGTTISEQMEQMVAPVINKGDTEEDIKAKILEFTDGDYAGKASQLFEGRNVEKNPDFAMECLKMGVGLGDADSELMTAKVEAEGLYGQKKDLKHAQELLHKLAQNGNIEAQYMLGSLLGELSWYKKAAQQGHVESMYRLGSYYANKLSKNSADNKLAEQWLKAAADKNHYDAAYELASLYYENLHSFGEGCATIAFRYAQNAAEHENSKAQQLLSRFYYDGFGCKEDSEQSEYWRDRSYDIL